MTNVSSGRVFSSLLLVALAGVGVQLYRSFIVVPQFQLFALRVVTLFLEALPFLVAAALLGAVAREVLPEERVVRFCGRHRRSGLPVIVLSGLLLPPEEHRLPALFQRLRSIGTPVPHLVTALLLIPIFNPVMLIATVTAFPALPAFTALRVLAGLVVALGAGALLAAWTPPEQRGGTHPSASVSSSVSSPISSSMPASAPARARDDSAPRVRALIDRVVQNGLTSFLSLGRYFLVAAVATGLIQSIELPVALLQMRTAIVPGAVVATGVAYLLAAPTAGDAFIARGLLTIFPLPVLMGFLVVGPMLNLRTVPVIAHFLKTGHVILLHFAVFALGIAAALATALLMQGAL